ncbi:MAG: DUF4914 family protein [Candidatus Omnitrophica bacterium]|nr:DUF4914 family protein [Candidatus Omnitrophota bacterium]
MKKVESRSWRIPQGAKEILGQNNWGIPNDRQELFALAMGGGSSDSFEVAYEVPGKGRVVEAVLARCENGIAVNYPDDYMRRRDPESMVIADDSPTDKITFEARFGLSFDHLCTRTIDWLKGQELIVVPFSPGQDIPGHFGILLAPRNASFFAAALADIQMLVDSGKIAENFCPKTVIYLAPQFRHEYFGEKQVVVHRRSGDAHEIFAYNLYPGPSAKKGVYSVLLDIGEKEGWLTLHASTVQIVTPYDNTLTILHEGASGGGKSEMLEYIHREDDGRICLGKNVVTGEARMLTLGQGCVLRPVTDDMALCHSSLKADDGKLVVVDAENAWFVRVNHIGEYGTDPHLEKLCIHPPEPLIFLNLKGIPRATCLLWEHMRDKNGEPCPNPRVILPRRIIPNIINGPVSVDVRSFGIRMPACTRENPTYGLAGLFHFLPPALAWLWRLVSPRGHNNPSIVGDLGLCSEGVGSYGPFLAGRSVVHANMLLKQIMETKRTRYVLIPNQHIGAWKVGFMPQWIAREYLARRGGAKFKPEQLAEARCPLLGFVPRNLQVEGTFVPDWILNVDRQAEVGSEGYDAGALILYDFFAERLKGYLSPDIHPIGREIILCCLDKGQALEYERFSDVGIL